MLPPLMFSFLDYSASTSTSYSILFWGIIQICIWGYYLVLFWETASSPFCSVQSLDLEPVCGGFKTCPQILRHSYSWMLEHNLPPLKCGLTLVTLFKWTEWGDSDGVWLLRLSHKRQHSFSLERSQEISCYRECQPATSWEHTHTALRRSPRGQETGHSATDNFYLPSVWLSHLGSESSSPSGNCSPDWHLNAWNSKAD